MTKRDSGGGSDDDQGSILPMVAVWLAVATMMIMGLVAGAEVMARRAQAQAAADAGALAGAADGRAVAEQVVARNGAVLTGYRERAGPGVGSPDRVVAVVVDVVVEVDGVSAEASAERFMLSVEFP